MAPRSERNWCFPGRRPRLAWLVLLLLLTARKAGAAPTDVHYLADTTFRVPFVTNPNEQRRLQQVLLHVSENMGRSYQHVRTAGPNDTEFQFTATHQGWYWFIVQAQYVDGRFVPANVQGVQPGLKICVDTVKPVVNLRQVNPMVGTVGVEWDVREDNPDQTSLRLEYRPVNTAEWIPLNAAKVMYGQYGWTPATNATQLEVHMVVRDLAGNVGEGKITANVGNTARSGPANDTAAKVAVVNTRRIKLNYDLENVGKSDVSVVEVWMTQNKQKWELKSNEPPKKPDPCVYMDVPGEGRYGFTILARSGAGRAEKAPSMGDEPDIWVQVDETKPMVHITGYEVGTAQDAGKLLIKWTATDNYQLADRPITISYSINPPGQDTKWTPVAEKLTNDGRYIWVMPDGLHFQFYLRVEATDAAGNVGFDQTPKPVVVDLNVPKVHIKGAEGAQAAPGPMGALISPVSPMPPANGVVPVTNVSAAPPLVSPTPSAPLAPVTPVGPAATVTPVTPSSPAPGGPAPVPPMTPQPIPLGQTPPVAPQPPR
jgi:hypothetical protein